MRSSLVRFFICVIAGFIAVPAFGQSFTQQVNSQSADYWQSSSSRSIAAPSNNQHVGSGYDASCPCDEPVSPTPTAAPAPLPAPTPTAYMSQKVSVAQAAYSETMGQTPNSTAGYYNNTTGQNGAVYSTAGYNSCPPAYGGTCPTANDGYAYAQPNACNTAGCGGWENCDPCNYANYAAPVFGPTMMDMGCGVFPCSSGQWFLTGWIQQGVTINPRWPDHRFNGAFKYNDRANDYQLNQLYLTFGRAVNSEACKWDIGGRVDLLYGTDYFFTSALGLETETYMRGDHRTNTLDPLSAKSKWNKNDGPRDNGNAAMYGFSMPQLYGEVQSSFGTNVKLGHFYSPMGHESVMATQNFFYSHSYSMMYGEPTTLTGMVIAQRFTRNLTGYFGLHRGWNKWDTPIDEISYLAGAKWENIYQTTSLGFFINTGKDAYGVTEAGGRKEANRTNYSLVFSHQLSPCLHYVLQHDLGVDEDAGWDAGRMYDGQWYSIAQYIYLQMTPTLAFGCRAEWFRDKNHTRVLGLNVPKGVRDGIDGDEFVDVSLGFNWKPTTFITFRPEVRWDWAKDCKIFNDGKSTNLFTIGADLVVNF